MQQPPPRTISVLRTLRRRARNVTGMVWHQITAALALALDPWEALRLRRKIRQGELKSVRCLVPFTTMEFLNRGLVSSCCEAYTRVPAIGNIKRGSIEEIWNGRAIRRVRRRLLLGETGKVCRPACPFLLKQPVVIADMAAQTERGRQLKEDLTAGRVRLRTHPAEFHLSNWGPCNLRCIMCASRTEYAMPSHVRKTQENLKHFFDKEIRILLTGNGDLLARPDTRQLLEEFDANRYRGVEFEILTNGLLWTPKMWERIKHCHFHTINISVDAATPETYERIRRGGRWEALVAALDLIRQALSEGRFRYVMMNMTVMRSNYREIPAFIALARRYGFHAVFAPIHGTWADENIFALDDRAALEELRQILTDPALYGPNVDLRSIPGANDPPCPQ